MVLLATLLIPATARAVEKPIDFNRDIRPIISENCFHCHGPDEAKRKSGARLDLREAAIKPAKSGLAPIVPGSVKDSEIIARVESTDDEDKMPPNKSLTPAEVALLKRWIKEGAEYKSHWSFIKPVRSELPTVSDAKWPRNGVDNFVLARLDEDKIAPAPEADPITLLRRATLDLTGLPPTLAEIDAITKDTQPGAYERAVDRLLASPRYGEHMATLWLDGARYADSHGYQADWERYMWPWRDWVINAFNRNLPFDQFTVEQIAGDLLPNATTEQRVATGFNRNHRINTEAGIIPEEWRIETVIDRVETTGTVWMGLTLGCARCHDHKYDPVSQKEFYQFFAFYNNISETGTGKEKAGNHPPFVKAPRPSDTEKLAALLKVVKEAEGPVKELEKALPDQYKQWEQTQTSNPAQIPEVPGLLSRFDFDGALNGARAEGVAIEAKITKGTPRFVEGRIGKAILFEGKNENSIGVADKTVLDLGGPFSVGGWVKLDAKGGGALISKWDTAKDRVSGFELQVQSGEGRIHVKFDGVLNVESVQAHATINLQRQEWTHVVLTSDGTNKLAGLHLFINGSPVELEYENDTLLGELSNNGVVKIGGRVDGNAFNGAIDDLRVYSRVLMREEIQAIAAIPAMAIIKIPAKDRKPAQLKELAAFHRAFFSGPLVDADRTLARAKKEYEDYDTKLPTVMVMEELPKPRDAFILIRGEYDKKGEKVTPALPKALPPLPEGAPMNRLGLAKWIVDPSNPLTARVAVNRFWERFFGVGIVKTSDNFGSQSEWPSHPELLDWLATEFVRIGWDQKAFQKLIVTSAAYRQSSKDRPEIRAKDPENRLVARGPRFRLQAEVLRDQALNLSGLLVERVGGPSVKPYQPEGIWDEMNVYGNMRNYKHDTNDGLYRRSLYTIWKRTSAPPGLTLFDMPNREICTVKRSRTNTPLQALTLLNDTTFVEASRALGQRMIKEGGATADERIAFAFRLATARVPSENEAKLLKGGFERRLAKFKANIEGAKKLIAVGDSKPDAKIDPAELAAYATTASVILNLDETITKE